MSAGEKEQACRDQDHAAMEMMTYDEGNDDCDYFGDEADEGDIPPANKSAEKRRPVMHLAGKGQPLITPPSSTPVRLHISQRGFIISTFSVKALSQVKFNGAPGK